MNTSTVDSIDSGNQTQTNENNVDLPNNDYDSDNSTKTPQSDFTSKNILSPKKEGFTKDNSQREYYRRLLSIVAIQLIIVGIMLGISVGYGWFHGVPQAFTVMFGKDNIEVYKEAIANYDFVGVSPENPQPSFFTTGKHTGKFCNFTMSLP